ncbi:MAG: protein kinase, partial [Acidimicrobiia bacterium]
MCPFRVGTPTGNVRSTRRDHRASFTQKRAEARLVAGLVESLRRELGFRSTRGWDGRTLPRRAAGGGHINVRPSGTITFLFTDIEGSTLHWEADRDAMRDALALHDRVLRGAIDGSGGYVFATGGDAFSAAFASAEAAIAAALSAQRELQNADWGATGRLRVRMAIHTGSVEERDGNYFGPPLNRCARILSAAAGDDVLVSLTTQQLLRGTLPSGTELVDIGELRLKDLGLSDRVFRLTNPDLVAYSPSAGGDVGRKLRGYELIERIGEGGFGVVYRARQPGVGREVAIKVVRADLANDPEFIRRFDAEAQLVARLEHPYVVPLYDYWREPDGAYLVMRWMRGGNLKTALRTGPWQLDATVQLMGQIGGALALAHRHGVVHRDIKPANILIDEEGNAYLSDFGIAQDITHRAQLDALDASTMWPAYASPEQLRREPASALADVYSLGMVLHELVTGAYPFGGSSPSELLERQVTEPLPDASSLRPDIPQAL